MTQQTNMKLQPSLGLPSKGRIARTLETILKFNDLGIILSNSRCYLGKLTTSSNLEIRLMSAPNVASELTSGNLSFGLTGLDLMLETNNKHIKLLKRFNQSEAKINLLTPLSWSKSVNLPPLRLCLTPILSSKYQQISRHYITTKNIKQLHVTKCKSTTEIEPFVGISNIIIDITSSGSTAKTNLLNSSPTSIILTSTLCLFYNQTSKISSKINTLIHILCHLLTQQYYP
ncbi:ATP phosphoribosyltransferase [Candidatus Hodgkinia cicadicola]|uniref:ATP phosphoribosyltransferase n=1 Tax=Candidatus Hodgkinia cicadicola TaxID=573658 RepID=A0ABX4MF20_9HYPH|nr:ATP phosphoribosyltransferase [Candidatus Hodgkinia cicadicola]PIM96094.1 ATP phosphoribosyltransferase [Candidatus Hodgkinia cicadicola]